ncbi:hypothetical protein CH251_12430 [Rhodococcus sp. 06-462-5]|nr:hypothetical protein CH251_12430 [Rhodococcus sp. 06-462-5]OZE68190.1 hypothetical protein CH270_09390 [Rhodococcus sp. 02-925g]OZF51496.1 hypothetical protein CH291_05590 [Rhodococcus sp. 14-1411-2a]
MHLRITESARNTMVDAATRAHPVETGGILIGVYADGHPWIVTTIEIASTDRGRSHYWIPGGATHTAVLRARAIDDRLGYLGDWHSHPRDVGPSTTDLASLALISMTKPRAANPTQIVVRRTDNGYTLDARRMSTFAPRICTIGLTGPLPSASAAPFDQTAVLTTPDTDSPGAHRDC